MKLSTNNFLMALRNVITTGGGDNDKGFLKTAEGVNLSTVKSTSSTAGVYSMVFPVHDLSVATGAGFGATTAGDVVTGFTPGHRFKLLALDFITGQVVGTGAGASAPCNLEIGTTNVTGGVCTVTLASTSVIGERTTGTAITALNTGSATDTVSIEKATSVVFTAGSGAFVVTIQNLDTADALAGTADETNALVQKIDAAVDTIGNVVWKVPRDYDEASQDVTLRVLASQLTSSTDNDVELDLEVYHKVPGTALTADLNPTAPGTVLSTTEQWVEFDLSTIFGTTNIGRDDVVTMELVTNGANDTAGEEVLIHDVELVYRSTLVSYDKETTSQAFNLR
jgi:hypothetical protein